MSRFKLHLAEHGHPHLRRASVATLQINVGKRCNQACHHCHVEAGPKRTEMMSRDTADRILALLAATAAIETVDVTGGAPELNPNFRRLVTESRRLGRAVIDRCNLTVLFEPGQKELAAFLAHHHVRVTASLPCYTSDNVDKQRGKGVFGKSIEALRILNDLGYGNANAGLELDLVYNPVGPHLPPPQASLEADYRERLRADFGVEFNQLFTITNMPIKRFAEQLARLKQTEEYMGLLVNHFNPGTVDDLMCRHLISVGYDGQLYDCDFNQMLDIHAGGSKITVWDIETFADLVERDIATDSHCFGCTAGAGSSCGGSLT